MDIVIQIIAGLKVVHRAGIIRKNISPDNIYITKDGQVRVLDFEVATYLNKEKTNSFSVIIKPGYAPIEEYGSKGLGTWTDVYGLSATFYRMITGTVPPDSLERCIKDSLNKPSRLGIMISECIEIAIMNALNIEIKDRTQSMEEFEKELFSTNVKAKIPTQYNLDVGRYPLWVKIGSFFILIFFYYYLYTIFA